MQKYKSPFVLYTEYQKHQAIKANRREWLEAFLGMIGLILIFVVMFAFVVMFQ